MKTENPKGFQDTPNAEKRIQIRNIIEETFKLYNFTPVETPIIEYQEFVQGNNSNDEAVSDIFKLKDKGNRELALRYEFTFQLKRLAKNKKLPYKRYQIGPVFRDEPITGNRWRQFTQCDIDTIGSTIKDEAEILKATSDILNKLKIKFTININNRKLLNEILKNQKITNPQQVIKEIDKLDKLPESEIKQNLKKYNAQSLLTIFKKPESYFKKYKAYEEIQELKKTAQLYKIKLNFQPFLARGLSYYNGSIFEIKSQNLKETIIAGGSYLINNIQATGISLGLERLELLANIPTEIKKILIISLNQDKTAISLANTLREQNIPTQIYYNRPGKALDYANSNNIPLVIFIGEQEAKQNKLKIKNMNTGKEKLIPQSDIEKELKKFN
jgi:histidyl-tRNA synthetase